MKLPDRTDYAHIVNNKLFGFNYYDYEKDLHRYIDWLKSKNKGMKDLIIEMANHRGLDLPSYYQDQVDDIANQS